MAEYIKRAAIDFPFLNSGRIIDGKLYVCLDEIYAEVKQLPAADVVPVVHGRWIQEYRVEEMRYSPDDIERYKVPDGFSCSICSKWSSAETNYCPNCGARMDGGAADGV